MIDNRGIVRIIFSINLSLGIKGNNYKMKFLKIFFVFVALYFNFNFNIACLAEESASVQFQINIPSYIQITPTSSPVLLAYISDKTGNLSSPLRSTFKVISNTEEEKTLYLNANVVTADGYENAFFERNGDVYVAFARLAQIPKSQALINCKIGANPADSPGIVAYPIRSVEGAKSQYINAKQKYEVYVKSGITNVGIDIGTTVLKDSFAENDPNGYYQAILSLTETDM